MTLLVVSINVETLDELRSRAERAWAAGAEAVEVRIDTFHDDPAMLAAYLKTHKNHTWIVTCRKADEGGRFRGDLLVRVSRLAAAARGTDAFVDFELADWSEDGESSKVRQNVCLAAAKSDGSGHRLILSAHECSGMPENLSTLVDTMAHVPEASCAKVAYKPNHICDTFETLDLLHERAGKSDLDLTVIAMGEDGLWTRVLAKKFGAFASYCALEAGSATATGQVALDEMVKRYRWPAIDASTKVFGVIGGPVAHSMSPLLFNHWFAASGINAIYLPLRVAGEGCSVGRFLDECRRRPWLDIGGFSVTIPHKTSALHWVNSGADSMAESIGALNTLVFRENEVTGHNTDCYSAVSSMTDALGCSRSDLAGLPVDVLGDGGAARAVIYGLYELGCKITIYGRSLETTLQLADKYGAGAVAWPKRVERDGEVLINCTSVGSWPDAEASPMPADALAGCRLVFDVIYNPLETRLLKDAAAVGVKTLNGLDMFVRQATMQYTLWTGNSPDTRYTHDMIAREVKRRTN